jgi:galactokinase
MRVSERGAFDGYHQRFGVRGRAFRAPARVNLIGEHTDYTGGLVMPMAIEFQTVAVISPRVDGRAFFYSKNYEEEFSLEGRLQADVDRRGTWNDYPVGVLWALGQDGIEVGGFSMTLWGDVPLGAGLSSSASVSVATAMALLDYAGVTLPVHEIAGVCRRAENEYVGAKTGVMDQFVVAGAVAHRVMLLDTRAMTFELLPLPEDVRVVICNSMVKHRLADVGGYGDRRGEVEAGQTVVRRELGIEMLRDATMVDLKTCKEKMSEASFKRCRHIITENVRVVESRVSLLRGDVVRFGKIMMAAHVSMRDNFEASCAEVDALVEIAVRQEGCYGARITGGGFGGCTVNLVKVEAAEEFVAAMVKGYEAATGIVADCFVCAPSDGALALRAAAMAREGAE